MAVDLGALPGHLSPRLPWRATGRFMVACGVVTTVVWLGMGLLPAVVRGETPESLASYSTLVTHTWDMGIITPATVLVGYLLFRRAALGYLLAFPLLGILVLLGPAFVAQPISQTAAGVSFTPAEIVGPICGFGILSLTAVWFLAALLRHTVDVVPGRGDSAAPAGRGRGTAVLRGRAPVGPSAPAALS